jgi:Zn-dependent protease with chaperone function
MAGAAVACPHCQVTFDLPESDPSPASLDVGRVAAAFSGPIPAPLTEGRYRLALAAVAMALVGVITAYGALVVGLAFALAAWIGWGLPPLLQGPTRPWLFFLLQGLFFLSVAGGLALLLFFLIKPVFARRREPARALTLRPEAEPVLFAFLELTRDAVGAPPPDRVEVDCRLNASARYRRREGGFILTLGLPLVAGLSARQLAGVVAHELGHFRQRSGLRTATWIRQVHGWLRRVAVDEDGWDAALESWAMTTGSWRLHVFGSTARFALWITRGLLKAVLYAGEAVSCLLLREMEFDADRVQIDLAGTETFEETFRRLKTLRETLNRVYQELRVSWNLNRRLPDNLPEFLRQSEAALSTEQRTRWSLRERPRDELFATHPGDDARLDRARDRAAPGRVHLDAPATALFADFAIVARQVTLLHYQDDLGLDPSAIRWVPVPNESGKKQQAPGT